MKFLLHSFLLLLFFSVKNSTAIFSEPAKSPLPAVYKDSAVTDFFKRSSGCIAGDGGFSVPLGNHKILWLMGDSHIDDYDAATATVPCLFQVRNTALLQPANDWQPQHTRTLVGAGTGFKNLFKNNTDDNFFCWPGAGLLLKDTAYVYCSSFKNQGSGAFAFAPAGSDFFAKVTVKGVRVKGYSFLPDFNGINFGIGFIKDGGNKWIYAYGQKYIPAKIECDLYVARFRPGSILKRWQYWNGNSWGGSPVEAAIIARQTGVSGTFQVSCIKNRFVLLSSQLSINCDSGTDIYAATAGNTTGPFSAKKIIYTIDEKLKGHTPFFYAAIAHTEYINDKDQVLVTYAINGYGTCVPDCNNNRMDPGVYRLRGIRVSCKLFTHQ